MENIWKWLLTILQSKFFTRRLKNLTNTCVDQQPWINLMIGSDFLLKISLLKKKQSRQTSQSFIQGAPSRLKQIGVTSVSPDTYSHNTHCFFFVKCYTRAEEIAWEKSVRQAWRWLKECVIFIAPPQTVAEFRRQFFHHVWRVRVLWFYCVRCVKFNTK